MRYIADILTTIRLVISFVLFFLIINNQWMLATIFINIAALTDAFDGIFARKWPYTAEENKKLFWRRCPHAMDNIADSSVTILATIGLILIGHVSWIAICLQIAVVIINLIMIKAKKEKVILTANLFSGFVYSLTVATIIITLTIYAFSEYWIIPVSIYAIASIFLFYLKRDRIKSCFR